MKPIEHTTEDRYKKFGMNPTSSAIVSSANSVGSYLTTMLDEYKKLQEQYNKVGNTEPMKEYKKFAVLVFFNKTGEDLYNLIQKGDVDFDEMKKGDLEFEAYNKEASEHNQKVFNHAKEYMLALGFKPSEQVRVRSKYKTVDAAWLTSLNTQFNLSKLNKPGSSVEYYYGEIVRKVREYELQKDNLELQAKKEAEAKAKKEAEEKQKRKELLLIAKACLQFDLSTDIDSIEVLDKELEKRGFVPLSVKLQIEKELGL